MMDLAKLKVVDLRAELGQRGLDTKGNKPVLIERLRKALEEESGDPKSAADASAQDTDEENAGKASHREARERTPEPVPPKTPGRSSRSSATPSKAASHRGNPKILLTPLTEKQITPTKSPPAEKTEKALPEKSEKATPEKQDKVSPEKQVKTTPEKQVKATPEKRVKTTPEKQVKTTPEKQVKTTPEKQMKASPEKQEKTPPAKQEKTSPAKQEKTSPAKQEKTSPEKQEKTSPEKQEKTSPEKQEKTSPETQEKATPEKQEKATPEKQEKTSPRKQEKISPLINEAPPDEAKEATKSKDDIQPQEEAAPEHLEAVNQAVETETGADQPEEFRKDEETSDDVIEKQTEPASEKSDEINKPAIEAEETVKENEKEEETPAAVPDVSEDTKVDTEETAEEKNYEENVEATAEEAENAEEKPQVPEIENEDNLLEDEAMETNEENEENEDKKDFGEPMEMKSECTEEDESTDQTTETTDQTTETTDQTTETTEQSTLDDLKEEKPDIELKEEVDDKSDVQRTLAQNEEDVEMTDIKEESQEDLDQDSKDRDRRDRRDRKRKRSSSPQEDRHKSPQPSYKDDEPDLKDSEVVLSWYDSDLNLVINRESFVSATAMHNDGFGYIWAGARASFGFTEGKVYYESKITECCDINLPDEAAPHVLRVGWSILGTTMQLGEEPLTYGFGGTGKISTGNRFIDYGEAFGKDDVIGCYVDFTAENNVVISYTKNGRHLGTAFTISKSTLGDNALFPHVLTKNCTFECNFGQEKSWCEDILEGYVPVGFVDIKDRTPGPRRPEKRGDCEIIMMCGLPAAGKTVWATKYAQDHPERMYNVLGTNALIEKMKVIGLPRKRNYHGRWEVLITKCTRCLNKLLDLAATRRRNYILDQTNVYPSAQRRKMRSFYGYMRRAVVLVPTEEEFKARTIKRTACEGEVAPESAVLEMKANFGIPVVGESFDVIEWAELPEVEARKLVEKYNKEGKDAGFGQQQPSKRPRFESRDNHRESRDNRQSSRDSRDSRDHRDRRNNYPDRSRTSTWRGGSNSGGGGGSAWRDRQPRPAGGHVRHGGGSGGYGGPSGGGWRGRGAVGGPPSSYRPPVNDRRVPVHDRRTSGSDRNRSAPTRQGGWGPMNSYQSSQQSSGGWGGSQSGNWPSSQSQQQGSWGGQQTWGQAQHQQQQQQQQWGNWKGYGTYGQQSSYGHQGYGNGNWGSWNQQYYNQYWGQQQPTSQTSAAGSQAVSATGSTTTGNSTASTGSTYSSYSPAWQGYAQSQSYSFPAESSNTNAQQQK